ncbi:hypothetical protein SIID45300_00538 [Candidatus Magnetaquicoccaceae bacterium FCR-1]|uniref:Uncharacterized protein n=1 Tax=Candidatus Magnetaquiglobus chichijimensis TaxID=3141448 RepID=A0ABQ0C5S1_9PROT
MMFNSLTSRIKSHLFPDSPATTVPVSDAPQRIRALVATFSCGNLNLQMGRYTTAQDVEQIKTSMRDYHFVDSKR